MESNGRTLTPKNWTTFQHYKDRNPQWIKLQVSLLDDPDFMDMPVASRFLCFAMWLLASKFEEGRITLSNDKIAWRLRMTQKELEKDLGPIVDKGFMILSGGDVAASRSEVAETEKGTKRSEVTAGTAAAPQPSPAAQIIYDAYPRKVARPAALRAINKALESLSLDGLLALTKKYATARIGQDPNFTPHPATWFNQERYLDDPETWKDRDSNRKPTVEDEREAKLKRIQQAREQFNGPESIGRMEQAEG